jgi:hypothetical protein
MISALQFTQERRVARYDDVTGAARHAFCLLMRNLEVAPLSLVTRMQGEPSPCVRILATDASEEGNLLRRFRRTISAIVCVAIDRDVMR